MKGKSQNRKRKGPKTKNSQNFITTQTQKNERFRDDNILIPEEEDEGFESDKMVKEVKAPKGETKNYLVQSVILRIKTASKENFMLVEQTGPDMHLTSHLNKKIYLIVPFDLARTMSVGKTYDVTFEKKDLFEIEGRGYVYFFSRIIDECI